MLRDAMHNVWCWLDTITKCKVSFFCRRHVCQPKIDCPEAKSSLDQAIDDYFRLKEATEGKNHV